jgi:hypothetical protein
MHGINATVIGGNGIAHRHGFGVTNGQVLRQLRLGAGTYKQSRPRNRALKRRNSHLHEVLARRLLGLEALDIQGHGDPEEHIRRIFGHTETGVDVDDVVG